MIISALLFAAGFILGLRFRFFVVILFGSMLVATAYAALILEPTDFTLLTFLMLFAHLTALQGGFLLGQFIGNRRGGPPR